ncbi:metal-dependent hydrolase [Terrilactibacillus laevilacticus]|uniref:Metal-dependent hydrolase n=1 Tax=Terrilactibacillus laevilacticus TaxID=1380157 RepID=A0ABW5PU79_9BACI|nr:metal-dependent hydrolase [Terrilactibacillus laevilacticus]
MDSGTHVVMGLGIAGLSTLDPVMSQSTATFHAVMIGTLVGSVIPDIDTVLKLKNNAIYIRNHRGITHSLPATLLWPCVITIILNYLFPSSFLLHVFLWTLFSVFLHVFVDIFNAYGTQAIRPISKKWVALCIIPIFDPVIFGLHFIGLAFWYFTDHAGVIFLTIYMLLIVYYILRTYQYHQTKKALMKELPNLIEIYLSPNIRMYSYHFAAKSKDQFYVGKLDGKAVFIIDQFDRPPVPSSDLVLSAKQDKNIRAFLSFSPIYRWELKSFDYGYELRFIDLRYYVPGHYPFVAVALLSKDLTIESSYTGWVFSEKKLRKKLIAQTHMK